MIRKPIGVLARVSIPLFFVVAAFAQLPSAATLKGSYYVRYLGEDTRTPASTMSFSGTMVFDGAGGFTLTGQGASSKATDKVLKTLSSGKYSVLSSGMVAIDNPFDTSTTHDASGLFGGIGKGLIVASSTEGAFLDLFVAVPASTANSAASLSGTYNVASVEFLNGVFTQTRNTFFPLTADGKGGLGDVTVKGTAQSLKDAQASQTSAAATYTVTANGTGTLVLPAPVGTTATNVLLSGSKVLYAAADGSFFIAGGATSYDFIIGAKTAPGVAPDGLYFTGYLENYAVGSDIDEVFAVSGSTNVISSINKVIAHERTNGELFFPWDRTYSGTVQLGANGVTSDGLFAIGAGGNLMIGAGSSGDYFLQVYAKSVPMTASGAIFLNPQGVVNAANNTPVTAQFSPGEVITLYGSGFTTQTVTTSVVPFPATLGGAQVNISFTDSTGKAVSTTAPVYFASPGQISAVIPYTAPTNGGLLTLSVSNGATKSNEVTVYSGPSSPGIFTIPTGGIGNGAILHADFSLVSTANPAKSGETVQVFLTGLGAVNANVAAGAAGPSPTFASVVLPVDVEFYDDNGYHAGKVTFAGLAPGLGGLYQVNVTLPTGLLTGNLLLYIYVGDGSDFGDGENIQATIPVGK